MKTPHIIISIACIAIAVVIFVFADGARAVYSGLFFIVIGAVVFFNAWRQARMESGKKGN